MPMINLCVCVVVCACVWNGNEEIEREGRNSGKSGGMRLPRQWRIVSTDRYLYGLARSCSRFVGDPAAVPVGGRESVQNR